MPLNADLLMTPVEQERGGGDRFICITRIFRISVILWGGPPPNLRGSLNGSLYSESIKTAPGLQGQTTQSEGGEER